MIKCPACGEENPSGVGLCKSCGGRIAMTDDVKPDVAPGSLEEELLGLLRGGKKIEAIKLYREKKGVDLLNAKNAVEALAKEHNITPSGAGCAGILMIVAAAAAMIVAAAVAIIASMF